MLWSLLLVELLHYQQQTDIRPETSTQHGSKSISYNVYVVTELEFL